MRDEYDFVRANTVRLRRCGYGHFFAIDLKIGVKGAKIGNYASFFYSPYSRFLETVKIFGFDEKICYHNMIR